LGRDERSVKLEKLESLNIFLDNSSIEIFINYGEEVFTSRCYCKILENKVNLKGEYKLKKFKGYEIKKLKFQIKNCMIVDIIILK
jgi:beta-fructofuranosidase